MRKIINFCPDWHFAKTADVPAALAQTIEIIRNQVRLYINENK